MIETLAETGSTNADLLARLRAGEAVPEGFWLRTEKQTGGRGRSGRSWSSPEGNLYASTPVSVRAGDPPAHTLSLVAGLAVWKTLRNLLPRGTDIMLKWPNDVLVDGAKIAGILLERHDNTVVVGIGVNVLVAPEVVGRETTSIHDLTGERASQPGEVLTDLAGTLALELQSWRSDGTEALLRRWMAAAHPIGTPLRFHDGEDSKVLGTFHGLTPDGALELRLEDGSVRAIHAGDVMLAS